MQCVLLGVKFLSNIFIETEQTKDRVLGINPALLVKLENLNWGNLIEGITANKRFKHYDSYY